MDYLEALKANFKVSKEKNGAVVCHLLLSDIALQEKHNTTIDTANEDHKIEADIKSRERYLTCMFLSRSDKLRYNQLNIDLKPTTKL